MKELSRTNHGNLVVVVYEAEETQELEFMKWYKHDSGWIGLYQGREDNIGFDHEGNYVDNIKMAKKSLLEWQPADMEEVKKLMIAEAERRFPKGAKIKDTNHILCKVVNKDRFWVSGDRFYSHSVKGTCLIWSPEKGWAEIVEPLFVNSLGEKFYENDKAYYVHKTTNTICNGFIRKAMAIYPNDTALTTEFMTKQSAEEYIKKNRKFEDRSFYSLKCRDGIQTIGQWYKEEGAFYVIGSDGIEFPEDFDSIGGKIEF